ncbi:MAG: hypothetical protein JO325_15780, partial [Solirubrobacterales bacterium]|nr:hypothetical protein [Solirubrobacterales bacterium]
AMKIAEFPEKALPLPAVALVVTVGAAVGVVGVETDGCGKPGASGFDVGDCAAATPGSASHPPTRTNTTPRTAPLMLPPR